MNKLIVGILVAIATLLVLDGYQHTSKTKPLGVSSPNHSSRSGSLLAQEVPKAETAKVTKTKALPKDHEVKALIVGPSNSDPGDLIVLDATHSIGAKKYAWVLANSSKSFLPVEGGSKAVFASGLAGDYKFVLVVAGVASDGDLDIDVAEHTVTIGTPVPPPPPPPVPPPPVTLTGFAKLAYEEAVKLPTSCKPKLGGLAANYDAIAFQLAAGGLPDPVASNAALKVRNQSLIPESERATWLPWFTAWAKEADKLPITNAAYVTAYMDTAKGLRAVP